MNIEIVSAEAHHVPLLVADMRMPDKLEIEKLGMTPQRGLWRSYKNSTIRKSAFIDDQIAAMWGCSGNFLGGLGHPWVLTAKASELTAPVNFAIMYRQEMRKMLRVFRVLQSWVDVQHQQCTRLMEIVGFKLVEQKPLGIHGDMFCSYEMRAE